MLLPAHYTGNPRVAVLADSGNNVSPDTLPGAGVRALIKHGSLLGISRLYYIGVRSVYILFLAWHLGPETYGKLNYALNWSLTFLGFSMLGIGDFIVRETSGKSAAERGQMLGTATGLRLVSAVVFTILVSLLVVAFEEDRSLVLVTLILTHLIFVRGMCAWNDTLYIVYGNPMLYAYLEMGFISVEAIGCVMLAASGYGLLEISTFIASVWWMRLVLTSVLTRHQGLLRELSFTLAAAKRLLRRGLLFAANAFFLSWLGTGLILMLRFEIDEASELGNLALVIQLTLILVGICQLALRPALPFLTRSVDRRDGKELVYLSLLSRSVVFVGAAAWFICLFGAEPFLSLILDESYRQTANWFGWCVFLVIPATIHAIATQVLIAHAAYWPILASSIGGFALFAGLLGLVGIQGSPTSILLYWGLAYLVVSATTTISCSKKIDYSVVLDYFLPLAILAVALAAPILAGISTPIWQMLVRLAALGLAVGTFYLVAGIKRLESA